MLKTAELSRDQKLALIYKHTHKDFKSHIDGHRTILVFRAGTCLVHLDQLTDAEIADKLAYALKKEADKKTKVLSN